MPKIIPSNGVNSDPINRMEQKDITSAVDMAKAHANSVSGDMEISRCRDRGGRNRMHSR